MEILSKWRDAGRLDLRKIFEDAIAKAPGPKAPARLTFLRSITQTHGTLFALCSAASPAERGAILRYSSNAAISMWRQGAWPSALGLQIAALNVASRFVTGADAAYVLAESDKIIEEAARTQNLAGGDVSRAGSWELHPVARLVPSRGERGRTRLRQLAKEVRQTKQAAFAEIAKQALQLSRLATSHRSSKPGHRA